LSMMMTDDMERSWGGLSQGHTPDSRV